MARLQSTCAGIPSLTTATKEVHESVTSLVIEASSVQQQGAMRAAAGSRPATASAAVAAAPPAMTPFEQALRSTAPASLFSPLQPGGGRQASAFQDPLMLVASAGVAGLVPALEMQGRTAELHFKVDTLEQDLRWARQSWSSLFTLSAVFYSQN